MNKKQDEKKQIAEKYQVTKKIGEGAFGELWQARILQSNLKVAVKREKIDERNMQSDGQLQMEFRIYKILCGTQGFPYLYYFRRQGRQNELVMQLLGPSTEVLFNACGRIFSCTTVALLATQMISRLQSLHEKTFLHRDQKPDNYCIGKNTDRQTIYLIDYGMCKRYMIHKQHIPYQEHKQLVGTVRYCSIQSQLGIEQSRRDDLEALGYILIYFAKGALPWQGLISNNIHAKYQHILEKKLNTTARQLCSGLPTAFHEYMLYCRGLRFQDTPDYAYLKKLFQNIIPSNTTMFDWDRLGIYLGNDCSKNDAGITITEFSEAKSNDHNIEPLPGIVIQ